MIEEGIWMCSHGVRFEGPSDACAYCDDPCPFDNQESNE